MSPVNEQAGCLAKIRTDMLSEIVVADAAASTTWNGDSDYQRTSDRLRGSRHGKVSVRKRDAALLVLGSSPETWVLGVANDEIWLVAPLQPSPTKPAHDAALLAAALTPPQTKLERVATLDVTSGVLAIQNAQQKSKCTKSALAALAGHNKAIAGGYLCSLPPGRYDVLWEDLATRTKGPWGSYDARAFIVPHQRTPRAATGGSTATAAATSTGAPVGIVTQPKVRAVLALAFSADGKTLFAGGDAEHRDPTLVVIEGDKVVERWKPPGSTGANLHAISLVEPDRVCVTSTWSAVVRAAKPKGKVLATYDVQAVASPKGTYLAHRDGKHIALRRTASPDAIVTHFKTEGMPIAFSPNEKLFLGDHARGCNLFEVPSATKLETYSNARCAAFSSAGDLAIGSTSKVVVTSSTGMAIATIVAPGKPMPISLAFSPNGKRLAVAYADRTARVWDLATKQVVHDLGVHSTNVHALAFSPDGRRLAVGAGRPAVKAAISLYTLA